MNIGQITEGFVNNALNREKELHAKRMKICSKCKLYKIDNIFGAMCNSSLYLNPKTDEISRQEKPGFTEGCGCILSAKTRVPHAHCPVDK